MLQNNLLLAIEVDKKMDRNFRLYFFNKSVKKIIMPGGFLIFLLFFLATVVTNQTTTWDHTFFFGALFWGVVYTSFCLLVIWLLKFPFIRIIRRESKGYRLIFYPDKIVRLKANNERKEFEKRHIYEIRHFPEVDVVFYKKNHRLFRKELVIPLTSLSHGQMDSYRNIIRTYTNE